MITLFLYFSALIAYGASQNCSSNCAACNQAGAGKCDECDLGFGLTSTNSCAPCSSNCAVGCSLTGAGKCDKCNLGYGLAPDGTCGPCDPSCNSTVGCNVSETCLQCNRGFGLTTSNTCGVCHENCNRTIGCNTAGSCLVCNTGYGLTNNNTCEACDQNCNLTVGCNTSGTCLLCNKGFGLTNNNTCKPCSIDCSAGCNQTGAGKCDKCDAGYGLASDGSCTACIISNCLACPVAVQTCTQCKSGYAFYSGSNACGACSQHCQFGCDQKFPTNCDRCDPGYGYIGTTFACGVCSSYCTSGCNASGAGKCDKCDAGYGPASNGSCGPCSANCNIAVGCNISGTCDQCNAGYELNSNKICAVITTTARATTTAIAKTSAAATTITPTRSIITTTAVAVAATTTTTTTTTTIKASAIMCTVAPNYGPMAGGTAMTIVTTWTRPNISIAAVYIGSNLTAGNLSQSTSASNFNISYQITALVRSPPITDESLIDKPLPIILMIYPDMVNVSTGMYFTYKRNPTIYDINPKVIPLSGGIRLNVTGSNLASSSNPRIRAVVIVWRNNSLPSRNESFGPCYSPNENGTQMICLSPPIYIPEDFLLYLFGQTDQYSDVYRRRKRRDVPTIDWLKGHGTPLTSGSRFKRSLNNIETNQTYDKDGDKMQVSMDAVFDGLQVPLESVGKFKVLNPPNISCGHNIRFDPKDSGTIAITGDGMDQYNGKTDYIVRIGNGFCNVTDLTNNVLTCAPPKDKPQQTESDKLNCGENLAVFIDVGNRTYRCSCLTYADNNKTTLITIIAATVGSVFLIFIAIVVISIIVKRFRTSDKPPKQDVYINDAVAEKRSDMMLTASRQPNYNRSLNAYGTGSTVLSPERHYNRVPRPNYSATPKNQPYGYHYHNPSSFGYAKTFEEGASDQPLRQIYLPYSRNI